MLKKLLCPLLFILVFTTACGNIQPQDDMDTISQRGKLIVGVRTDTKPFGFTDKTGKIQGFDIDLAKEIANDIFLDYNAIQFVPVTASNRISKLNQNEVDIVVATMSITEQRQLVVNFSKPYHTAGQAIIVPANSKISSLKQLGNHRVIIVYGSTGETSIKMEVPNAIIMGYKTYTDGFNALKSGKADAMIADDTILYALSMGDNSVKILPKRYSKEPYAVALRHGEASEGLKERVDYVIDRMAKTGKITQLQRKWGLK